VSYHVRCKRLAPQPVLFIRAHVERSKLESTVSSFLNEICDYIRTKGMQPSAPPYTRYHAFDDNDIDLETGVPVIRRVSGQNMIQTGEIPGGDYACTEHWGPYDQMQDAMRALNEWMFDHGRQASGPSIEVYWTDPTTEHNANRWRTELLRPLQPVSKAVAVA
jgi:effector-binding domain-containing protein